VVSGRAIVLAALVAACAGARPPVTARDIDAVLAAHRDSLMSLPGVVGTAVALCDRERCIKVLVADSTAVANMKIPARLEGYRVIVEVTGPFRPRSP
jgi:hypothetical protein